MNEDPGRNIRVNGRDFSLLIPERELHQRIEDIAEEIRTDYSGKRPLFLGILNGAFIFAADLIRRFDSDCEIEFIQIASYAGLQSTGEVQILSQIKSSLKGKHIIIVEDIVDTGLTMTRFMEFLELHEPESIAIASLLVKDQVMEYPVDVRYAGFRIPELFVIGYGLDYDGYGRQLGAIYQIKE